MSDEKKIDKPEEGLSDDELNEVSGGAGAVRTPVLYKGVQAFRTVNRLPNGASSIHVESKFGSLPGGGEKTIVGG